MSREETNWYCARTKPKHEHIAAANLRRNMGLEVFLPRLRLEKVTRRGLIRVIEPLFPGYLFVRCGIENLAGEIQHANGVSRMVQFGGRIPTIADTVIEDLRRCFEADEVVEVETRLSPGDEVTIAGGAFSGMTARVLRELPARKRVQILLEILGRPTTVEVERQAVTLNGECLALWAPFLAVPPASNVSPAV